MILTHCFCNFSLIWSSFGMSRLFPSNIHPLQYFYATRGSNLSVWSMEKLNPKSHFWLKFSKISKCLKKYLVSIIYYLKHYSQSLFKSLISIRRELMLFKISICEYIHILSIQNHISDQNFRKSRNVLKSLCIDYILLEISFAVFIRISDTYSTRIDAFENFHMLVYLCFFK